MKATELLKKDHAAVNKLFARYEKAGERGARKQEIFQQIKESLDRHAQIEEEIFYPAFREVAEDRKDEKGTDLVLEAGQEHHVLKTLLSELDAMSPSDEEFDAKLKVLQENVEHHVEEEQEEMFPRAERELGDERLAELGTELAARDQSLQKSVSTRIVDSVKTLIFGGESKPTSRSRAGSGKSRQGAARAAKSGGRKTTARARKQGASSGARSSSAGAKPKAKSGARAKQAASAGGKAQGGRGAPKRSTARSQATGRGSRAGVAARATSKKRGARAGAKGARGGRSAGRGR